MYKLDNDFLVSLGLGGMPVQDKNRLLQMVYEKLELNVGMRLAEKMSDEQLNEFERFIDGDMVHARGFLDASKPGWQQSPEFQGSIAKAQESAAKHGRQFSDVPVISEFAALSWLESNFPNYKQVVAEELEKLKLDVQAAAPQILASAGMPAQAPQQQFAPSQPAMPQSYGPVAAQPAYGPEPSQAPFQPQPVAPITPDMPPVMPGQPEPNQQSYDPENPFRTQNPEFGAAGAPSPSAYPAQGPQPFAPAQPQPPAAQQPWPPAQAPLTQPPAGFPPESQQQ